MPSPPAGGCTFAVDTAHDSARSAPIWSESVDPAVLIACCRPCTAEEPLSFSLEGHTAQIAIGFSREHIRLEDAGKPIRLDIIDGSVLNGPVILEPVLSLRPDLHWQLTTVQQLQAMLTGRHYSPRPDPRFARLLLALRALDACAEGASLRTIAQELLHAHDWPGDGEFVKSRARRLVCLAKALYRAGPRGVLTRTI